jgi:hypothetical protein
LNGSQGDLAKGLAAEHILGSAQETRIQAKGDEKSECDEALGRTLSNARAAVAISSFESTGLKFKLDLFAQGGHYYTATACIGPPTLTPVPVGLINMDTAAVARIEFAGELILEVPTPLPLDLRVVWQEMPTDAELDIIDPFNGVRSFDVEGNGERVVEVAAAGIWRLRVAARVEASASNAAISKEHHGKSLFFIEAR